MTVSKNSRCTLEGILRKTTTVYSLPLFYERLNDAINNPRSSLADIGRIISEDQGLTARLLRLANSPLFGYHAKIDSISRALALIGTQQVRDLALALSVMELFRGIPENLIDLKSFWKHNISCGILARNIAHYRREVNQERYFVTGMMHDIGILLMAVAEPGTATELLRQRRRENELLFRVERAVLDFDHAALGGSLLKKWGLPQNITEPVKYHHNPGAAVKYPLETAAVHVSDVICNSMGVSLASDWQVSPLGTDVWERLDIPLAQLENIVQQSELQMESTFAVLMEG
jgi:HD-like signal output (HDOD) protein